MASADAVWLEVFQRLCDATAHELKGAMNGVAVNLEVVRSRVTRPEAAAAAPFAESAARDFEAVIEMAEALLSLARSPRDGQVDVGRTARDVGVLLARSAAVRGTPLTIDRSVAALGVTSAPASAVRAAVGATLLAAVDGEGEGEIVCAAPGAPGSRVLAVTGRRRAGARLALDDGIRSAVRGAGLHLDMTETGATITFPE